MCDVIYEGVDDTGQAQEVTLSAGMKLSGVKIYFNNGDFCEVDGTIKEATPSKVVLDTKYGEITFHIYGAGSFLN